MSIPPGPVTASSGPFRTERWELSAVAVLCLLAVAERVYGITRQSLWSDELFAVTLSYRPFADILPDLRADGHPPLYVAGMYAYLNAVGRSDFLIRLPSLVFGVLWIPLTYWLGARWFSGRTGLFAATIVCGSYAAVYYSQEARAYTMLVAVCLLNLACFLEILFNRASGRGVRAAFVASGAVALYLHYSGFVFVAAEACVYALSVFGQRPKREWLRDAALFGCVWLLFLPWAGIMLSQLVNTSTAWAVSPVPDASAVTADLQRLLAPPDDVIRMYWLAGIGFIVLLAGHAADHRALEPRQMAVLLCITAVCILPIAALFVKSIVSTPIFVYRYFLFALPLFAVMTGVLADAVVAAVTAPQWRRPVLIVFCALLSIWAIDRNETKALYSTMEKDPAREAAAVVASDVRRLDSASPYTIIMTHPWLEHYSRMRGLRVDAAWPGRHAYVEHQIEDVSAYVRLHGISTLYYLALREPSGEALRAALRERYRLACQTTLEVPTGRIDVLRYDTRVAPAGDADVPPPCGQDG